jgi:ABC-type multidrug transport system ATPase subunit
MDLVEELADRVGIIRNGLLVREGSIPELRTVFNNFIYSVKLQGSFEISSALKEKYKISLTHSGTDYTEFHADCENPSGFYDFMSVLNESDADILSMQKSSDNLEEIFLRVLS